MDRERAEVEDLPPLELRQLRQLDLEAPSRPGRPAHISGASGVVRRGDLVYVIGDDELSLGVFRLSDPEPGRLERVFEGELPLEEDARKAEKPDLEALTMLGPFEGHPYGALFGLGSGSGPGRDRGFVWALAADGTLHGDVRAVDLSPLYDNLRERVDELNIEGCSVMGDRVWLLHRGNAENATNVVAELSLEKVMGSLREDLRIDAHELERICSYDLGRLGDVDLTFSDATPLSGDLLVFTASAEGETDGDIRGSVIGMLGRGGRVERLRTIDRRYKVEGVHASIDTGVLDFLFVCDQDDPDEPSPLLSAAMPLDAAYERR